MNKMSEKKTLNNNISALKRQQEDFEHKVSVLMQRENDEYSDIEHAYNKLEESKNSCTFKETKILDLINMKQNLLKDIQKHKQDFEDEIKKEICKKKDKFEKDLLDMKNQLAKISQNKKNLKEEQK